MSYLDDLKNKISDDEKSRKAPFPGEAKSAGNSGKEKSFASEKGKSGPQKAEEKGLAEKSAGQGEDGTKLGKGLHREENIFSYKGTGEGKSGNRGAAQASESKKTEGEQEEGRSLQKLREMAGKKEEVWGNKEPKKAGEMSIKTHPKKDENKIDFGWERNSPLEAPRPEDFLGSETRQRMRENKKERSGSEERAKSTGEKDAFGWEKRDIIEAPKPEDFNTTGMAETKSPEGESKNGAASGSTAENGEAKARPPEKGFKESGELSWLGEDKIETPKPDDFEKNSEEKPTRNEGEKVNKNLSWIDDNQKNAQRKPEEKKGVQSRENQQPPEKKISKEKESSENEQKKKHWPPHSTGKSQQKSTEPDKKGMRERIQTPIDKMFSSLSKDKYTSLSELTKKSGLNEEESESIAQKFEEAEIVELKYHTTPGKRPSVKLSKEIPHPMKALPKGETLSKYEMTVDFVPVEIIIIDAEGEPRPIYTMSSPTIGKYTIKFLDIVKDEVAETVPIKMEEILDPKKSKALKVRFFDELTKNLSKYLPKSDKNLLNQLSGRILHDLYGLGDIELFMADDMLEEVAINSSKTPITVYHRIYGWMKTNVYVESEQKIINYAAQIGRQVGREITVLKPILDAHLLSGDRVNSTLSPISSEGNTLTIRRFARKPWTIVDFIGKAHTMNSEMAALLWLAIQYEMNVLVAGGTASGKTSALNTLLAMVPPYHRVISIEDVREIVLPKYLKWNWVPMVTRSPNPEGLGEVTMLELMLSSLRMRPDRIIVGEIRRQREGEVLMEAIETGHSIYSTMHANSAYQVLRRLVEPPMNIPPLQVELLDLIVVQYRDRKTNKRRTYEIAEIEQTSSGQGLQVNTIYKWSPRSDDWNMLSRPMKLLTLLNIHTGMTEEDINKELDERKMILEWMKKNEIKGLSNIGLIMKEYYLDSEKVRDLARKNVTFEEFKEMV